MEIFAVHAATFLPGPIPSAASEPRPILNTAVSCLPQLLYARIEVMGNRGGDWLRQAEADLRAARTAMQGGSFEWACFAAQQAAEKAVKAVHHFKGNETRGPSVLDLLHGLKEDLAGRLVDVAKWLDRQYVPARYPNGFPSGAPTDFYTENDAEQAIRYADTILQWCRDRTR